MFILPRQARDKHREMLTERAFSVCSYRRLKCSGSTLVRERGFAQTFMLTTERLPRQARDRHKEMLEGKGTFCRRPRLG